MNKKTKYQPPYTQSRDWQEICSWYAELTDHNPVFKPYLDLVTFINNGELKDRLFAYTSVHKLVISIYENIEWNREALHIEFDAGTRKWFFEYYPKPFEPVEFKRKYEEEQGIQKFEKIINYLKW